MKKFVYIALLGAMVANTSCVTKKAYSELEEQNKLCEKNAASAAQLSQSKIDELLGQNSNLKKQVENLLQDTTDMSLRLHQLDLSNKSLGDANKSLAEQLKAANNDNTVKQLMADLQRVQERLQAREDSMMAVEKSMAEKERKVAELSKIIEEQNKSMESLKQRVSDALKGFEGRGMEVSYRDGKVYVSMDEKLLFQSGKWELSQNADSALTKLSNFLMENKDIRVMVEGHTDSLAYRGNGYIIDNWDLSAKRANAIVRRILKNKLIAPDRITSAARAEFVPVDSNSTREGRQRNRRTEIILTPNVDDVLNVFNDVKK